MMSMGLYLTNGKILLSFLPHLPLKPQKFTIPGPHFLSTASCVPKHIKRPKTLERVFLPNYNYVRNHEYSLPVSEIQHLRARRVRVGQQVTLFDGVSCVATAEIINKGDVVKVKDVDVVPEEDEGGLEVSVVVGGPKRRSRMDWMVEKLVEVGVYRFGVLGCERGEIHGRDVSGRLQRLMVSACKQCLRVRVPCLEDIGWHELVDVVRKGVWGGVFVLSCESGAELLDGVCRRILGGGRVLVVVGPEGGFTEKEEQDLVEAGAVRVTLGSKRLRVETAAIAAVTSVGMIHRHFDTT